MISKFKIFGCLLLCAAACEAEAQSGHADVKFWYEAGQIALDTSNGLSVATGTFATSGFFPQFENNPGFASEVDAGLGIGGHDIVAYNVQESLRYWNGSSFVAPGSGVQIRIDNNLGPDTIVSGTTGLQLGSTGSPYANYIKQAGSDGNVHGHVDYYLEPLEGPTPAYGAYGLKLTLSTSASGVADSDPFFVVFNFGLNNAAFDTAIHAFADLLAEPGQPGDFNGDGLVNLADYTVWRDHLGADENLGVLSGNGDGGAVTSTDYELWKTHFGSGSSSNSQAFTSVVPEPQSLWLVLGAATAMGVLLRRTRKGTA